MPRKVPGSSSVNWLRVAVQAIGDVRAAARIAHVRVATLETWIARGYCLYPDAAVALARASGYPVLRLAGFAICLPLGWHPRTARDAFRFRVARAEARTHTQAARTGARRIGIAPKLVSTPPDDDGGCRPPHHVPAPREMLSVRATQRAHATERTNR